MLTSVIGRVRLTGIVEGISYIILLFIAMPLKYFAGKPEVVTVVGTAHGILFLAFCLALLMAWIETRWPFRRVTLVFVCALLPFGPFFIDPSLKREDEGRRSGSS